QTLNEPWRFIGLQIADHLLPDVGVRSKSTAGKQVIAFYRFVFARTGHLGRDQSDVADVVLGAGVVASGEVDIERRIEFNPALAPVTDGSSVTFGVRRCELASGVAS